MEDRTTIITGADLNTLMAVLGVPEGNAPYRVRIHQAADGSGVKVKVNEGMWTPWLGKKED